MGLLLAPWFLGQCVSRAEWGGDNPGRASRVERGEWRDAIAKSEVSLRDCCPVSLERKRNHFILHKAWELEVMQGNVVQWGVKTVPSYLSEANFPPKIGALGDFGEWPNLLSGHSVVGLWGLSCKDKSYNTKNYNWSKKHEAWQECIYH